MGLETKDWKTIENPPKFPLLSMCFKVSTFQASVTVQAGDPTNERHPQPWMEKGRQTTAKWALPLIYHIGTIWKVPPQLKDNGL